MKRTTKRKKVIRKVKTKLKLKKKSKKSKKEKMEKMKKMKKIMKKLNPRQKTMTRLRKMSPQNLAKHL